MDAQGATSSPVYAMAPHGRRIFAKLIDLFLAGISAYGFGGISGSPLVGLFVGYGWLAISDAWSPSPGKALFRLRAFDQVTAQACTALQSLKRNAPILLLSVPNQIHRALLGFGRTEYNRAFPVVLWTLFALTVAWYVAARLSMRRDRWGRRPADRWAGTLVVKLK
ncbi:MAG: RDD family protein [Acidobacteriota bacterium]